MKYWSSTALTRILILRCYNRERQTRECSVSGYKFAALKYNDFADLPTVIEELGNHIVAKRPRVAGWSYNLRLPIPDLPTSNLQQPLHILRGQIQKMAEGECAALSADLAREGPRLGRMGDDYLRIFLQDHRLEPLRAYVPPVPRMFLPLECWEITDCVGYGAPES